MYTSSGLGFPILFPLLATCLKRQLSSCDIICIIINSESCKLLHNNRAEIGNIIVEYDIINNYIRLQMYITVWKVKIPIAI